ncbi:unnamed protein product, partial [Ectocarpus sp. 12 AP-2014]
CVHPSLDFAVRRNANHKTSRRLWRARARCLGYRVIGGSLSYHGSIERGRESSRGESASSSPVTSRCGGSGGFGNNGGQEAFRRTRLGCREARQRRRRIDAAPARQGVVGLRGCCPAVEKSLRHPAVQ